MIRRLTGTLAALALSLASAHAQQNSGPSNVAPATTGQIATYSTSSQVSGVNSIPVTATTLTGSSVTVTTAMVGQLVNVNYSSGGSQTVNLPSAATAGAGWSTTIMCGGTANCVLTPASGNIIYGPTSSATQTVPAGTSISVTSDGTNWDVAYTVGSGGGSTAPFSGQTTPPSLGSWSSFNSQTGAANAAATTISIEASSTGSSAIKGLYLGGSSTPTSGSWREEFLVNIKIAGSPSATNGWCFVGITDGANKTQGTFAGNPSTTASAGASQVGAIAFSNATTYSSSSNFSNILVTTQQLIWVGYGTDGTNWYNDISYDGYNWYSFASIALAGSGQQITSLSSTSYPFFGMNTAASGSSSPTGCQLLSYKLSTGVH